MTFATSTPDAPDANAPLGTGSRGTRVLGGAILVGVALSVVYGLFISPPDAQLGETIRIIYLHVPTVMAAYAAFIVTAVGSAMYLWKKTEGWDLIAASAAEIGVLFFAVTIIDGALWGKVTWGVFWRWEPRLTTSAVLLLMYIGYLVVSSIPADARTRATRCAVIGQAEWVPELHHSGHHHYHAMRVTLDELGRRGCRRPAVLLDAQTNQRGRRAWEAAFLVYHPQPRDAAGLILHGLPGSAAELQAWLARKRPDAVILHFNELVRRYQAWAPAAPGRVVCALRWSPDLSDLPGIDQRFDLVAANAVDRGVSQLITNQRGVAPVHPR